MTILQEDMETILERKKNPKEGSYTNYLFDKGIDKILKKRRRGIRDYYCS